MEETINIKTEVKAVMLVEQIKEIVEKSLGKKILNFYYAPRTKVFVVKFEDDVKSA